MSDYKYFGVAGAGRIEISESANWECGGKIGFSFDVEWGRHEFAGGVLSKDEALKLAEHILKTLGQQRRIRAEKLKILEEL